MLIKETPLTSFYSNLTKKQGVVPLMSRQTYTPLMGEDDHDNTAIHTATATMTRITKNLYPKQYENKALVSAGSYKMFVKDSILSKPQLVTTEEATIIREIALRMAATDPNIFKESWNSDKKEIRLNRMTPTCGSHVMG